MCRKNGWICPKSFLFLPYQPPRGNFSLHKMKLNEAPFSLNSLINWLKSDTMKTLLRPQNKVPSDGGSKFTWKISFPSFSLERKFHFRFKITTESWEKSSLMLFLVHKEKNFQWQGWQMPREQTIIFHRSMLAIFHCDNEEKSSKKFPDVLCALLWHGTNFQVTTLSLKAKKLFKRKFKLADVIDKLTHSLSAFCSIFAAYFNVREWKSLHLSFFLLFLSTTERRDNGFEKWALELKVFCLFPRKKFPQTFC